MVLNAAWQVSEQLEGVVEVFVVGISCPMLGCFLPSVDDIFIDVHVGQFNRSATFDQW